MDTFFQQCAALSPPAATLSSEEGSHNGSFNTPSPSSPSLANATFPDRLKQELSQIPTHTTSHVGDSCTLPYPGLLVSGLSEPLAFPLTSSQADALCNLASPCPHGRGEETVYDTAVRDCLQLEPSSLTFCNPAWAPAIQQLVAKVTDSLGLCKDSVTSSLYKLLIYRNGAHFAPHRDTEKEARMFGTLSIQLPCTYSGGEIVITHQGRQTLYQNGSQSGACAYSPHYVAFFADVQHEIRPVSSGVRIALVYNLCWLRQGSPPSASGVSLDGVIEALNEHASSTPGGAWSLGCALVHQYTPRSLGELGTNALKGEDRRNVAVLRDASVQAGFGQLNVVMVKLARTDREDGDGWHGSFDVHETTKGSVRVKAAYEANGTRSEFVPRFIKWTGIEDEIEFSLHKEGEVEYTGNEGASRETTYHALALAMWPKNKTVQLQCETATDIQALCAKTTGEEGTTCLESIISFKESLGADHASAWDHTKTLLDIALKGGMVKQIVRLMEFAAAIKETPDMDQIVLRLLQKRHPEYTDSVKHYLVHVDGKSLQTIEDRLHCLYEIFKIENLESSLGKSGFNIVLTFLEKGEGMKPRVVQRDPYRARCYDLMGVNKTVDRQPVWSVFLSSIVNLNSKIPNNEMHAFMHRFVSVIESLPDQDVKLLRIAYNKTWLPLLRNTFCVIQPLAMMVQGALARREDVVAEARLERRLDELLRKNSGPTMPSAHLPPTVFNSYRLAYLPYTSNRSETDNWNWTEFFSDVQRVFSSMTAVQPQLSEKYAAFLRHIQTFTEMTLSSIIGLLEDFKQRPGMIAPLVPQLQQLRTAVMTKKRSLEKTQLTRQIQELRTKTAVKPIDVQVRYPGDFELGEVTAFMNSDKMEKSVGNMGSIITARATLKKFKAKLPPAGMVAEAGGVGRNSYILLRKPFQEQREKWLQYRRDVRELNAAKRRVAAIDANPSGAAPAVGIRSGPPPVGRPLKRARADAIDLERDTDYF